MVIGASGEAARLARRSGMVDGEAETGGVGDCPEIVNLDTVRACIRVDADLCGWSRRGFDGEAQAAGDASAGNSDTEADDDRRGRASAGEGDVDGARL
jgi:hypothetical protein